MSGDASPQLLGLSRSCSATLYPFQRRYPSSCSISSGHPKQKQSQRSKSSRRRRLWCHGGAAGCGGGALCFNVVKLELCRAPHVSMMITLHHQRKLESFSIVQGWRSSRSVYCLRLLFWVFGLGISGYKAVPESCSLRNTL